MIFNRYLFGRIDGAYLSSIPLVDSCKILSKNSVNFNLSSKRFFAYYRFHKRIGKGDWNRYIERYRKPAGIENTQPILFNYRASFQSAKNSLSYLWELPKKIAASTTANQLLESWVYYRHKKKKLYHYVMALRRLNEIRDVDVSDWRFKLISNKVVKRARYFTDLPTVCLYLGNLKCVDAIERVTYHLIERMEYYSPFQLAKVASAFSSCRLFNKYLFSRLESRFTTLLDIAENTSITAVAKAFSNCMVYNFKLFNAVSLEFQRRLSGDTIHIKERLVNRGHLLFNFRAPDAPPTPEQLVDLAESFAGAKYRDLGYFDTLTSLLVDNLDDDASFDPAIIAKAVSAYSRLKLNDITLVESVLDKVEHTPCDFAPFLLASILKDVSTMVPKSLDLYKSKFEDALKHLTRYLDSMDNKALSDVAFFAHNAGLSSTSFMELVLRNLVKNSTGDLSEFDAPKLFELMSNKLNLDSESFALFCLHTRRLLKKLEPCDFMRTARVMRRLGRQNLTDARLLSLISLRVADVHEELEPRQYNAVARDLTLSGDLQPGILSELWSKNTLVHRPNDLCKYPRGFRPKLDQLELQA